MNLAGEGYNSVVLRGERSKGNGEAEGPRRQQLERSEVLMRTRYNLFELLGENHEEYVSIRCGQMDR
jgi:hypothetical protein